MAARRSTKRPNPKHPGHTAWPPRLLAGIGVLTDTRLGPTSD